MIIGNHTYSHPIREIIVHAILKIVLIGLECVITYTNKLQPDIFHVDYWIISLPVPKTLLYYIQFPEN